MNTFIYLLCIPSYLDNSYSFSARWEPTFSDIHTEEIEPRAGEKKSEDQRYSPVSEKPYLVFVFSWDSAFPFAKVNFSCFLPHSTEIILTKIYNYLLVLIYLGSIIFKISYELSSGKPQRMSFLKQQNQNEMLNCTCYIKRSFH